MAVKRSLFTRFAQWSAKAVGRSMTFLFAVLIVIVWAISGPLFHFSDTWQLVINTGTTIITFLMVFLIQNTQNRDGEAVQIKLDELIRAIEAGNNALLNLEELDEDVLDRMRKHYCRLAEKARYNVDEMLTKYESGDDSETGEDDDDDKTDGKRDEN
ncbi:MAG: low affinity iron permease family protein [Rhodanobacteraceae bacterium]|nr:low affinity iron permease family protein [Pseudomonadota bacterium]